MHGEWTELAREHALHRLTAQARVALDTAERGAVCVVGGEGDKVPVLES